MFVTCTHVRIIIFLYLTYLSGCYIKDGQEKRRPILFKLPCCNCVSEIYTYFTCFENSAEGFRH